MSLFDKFYNEVEQGTLFTILEQTLFSWDQEQGQALALLCWFRVETVDLARVAASPYWIPLPILSGSSSAAGCTSLEQLKQSLEQLILKHDY